MPEVANLNPLEDLAELLFGRIEPNNESDGGSLSVQLRFGEMELVDDAIVFTVSASRAYVGLSLAGLEIVPGTQLGETLKPNETRSESVVTRQAKSTVSASGSAKGGIGVGGLDMSASASAKASVDAEETTTSKSTNADVHYRVKARAGDKWEITEPDGSKLEGLYLNYTQSLCRVLEKRGANQRSLEGIVFVKQRDLLIARVGDTFIQRKLSQNKQKLLNILIAKSLSERASAGLGTYRGTVSLAKTIAEL